MDASILSRSCWAAIALSMALGCQAQAPLFHWPLDQALGTAVHESGGAPPGVLTGNAEWLPEGGRFHGGLRINGNNAYADLGPSDILTGATETFTAACWARPEIITGTERVLMGKATGSGTFAWSLSLVNNTGARARIRAGGTEHVAQMPPSSIYANAWYHFALTYDGTVLKLYLNGSLAAFTSASGMFTFDGSAPVTLGNISNSSMPFYGVLDDARIYDVALDQQQVVDLVIGQVPMAVIRPSALMSASDDRGPCFDVTGRQVPGAPRSTGAATGLSTGVYQRAGQQRRVVLPY